ncbi:synaptic vesicle 2-related protein [Asbolus verrucosus]|uniref:Synaptic vesicle 2-related protein n=1 Tax=Asbolus verrucosus TaxID=1661398 RepID=A0A482W706_ASBVE|nr:synaptic vesicle 2-related protein [Asbolus verrucosus]
MVLRRSKGYQDIDGSTNQPSNSRSELVDPDNAIPQDIEMASVSVVPDDTFTVTQAVNALGFGWFQVKLSLWTGLCWMADSMEMTILSILSPALHCDWHISRYQQALTTTVVFLGMMLSSTFWGNLSDRYGRKHCFWALGACFEVALALVIMPTLGWQWLLALSTGPLLAFALVCPWLPESPRFHVASGQTDKALETLEKVAKDNGKPMLLGRLVVDDATTSSPHRGRFRDLLTLDTCAADCKQLQTTDYMDLLWTTLAEFPGIFITIFTIERFGRKKTMAVQFVIYAICCCFLVVCTEKRVFLTVMLFLARGIIAGVFQAAYVYTPEVYPTSLRAVGVGSCSAMARLGAMVTPYVAQF